MISRVHIENFKSLKDVTVDLGRFTVLVGPNGCGKSGVLQAMMLAWHGDVEGKGWEELMTDPSRQLRVDIAGDELTFRLRIGFGDKALRHRLISMPDGASWGLAGTWKGAVPSRPMKARDRDQFRSAFLHPQAEKLAKPSRTLGSETPSLDSDGSALASVLAYIAGYDTDAFAAISRDLATVVPGVKRVRVTPAQLEVDEWEVLNIDGQQIRRKSRRQEPGHQFLIEFTDGRRVPSQLVSEGTAVALGILTLLYTPERPRQLLIDDIDRGLHIEAQANLIKILRKIMDLDPELQIVCTTHSPYLLDLVSPDEVRVLALDEERHTRVSKLTEHPEFEKWKFGTQTGELWAALGHAWVTEPRASLP